MGRKGGICSDYVRADLERFGGRLALGMVLGENRSLWETRRGLFRGTRGGLGVSREVWVGRKSEV